MFLLLNWFTSVTNIKTKNYSDVPYGEKENELLMTIHGYSEGDRFDKHIDIQESYSNRLYNVGVQLNDNYEGGEFRIWNEKDEEITVPKVSGMAVAYDIRFWHEIAPIKSGIRWSIVFPIVKEFIIDKRIM